jgi:hypothetical protein
MNKEVKSLKISLSPVVSSQISHIGHDPETNTMSIKYKSGGEYHYAGVDSKAFETFKGAKSLGKHFNAHFRGHKFTKLPEAKK